VSIKVGGAVDETDVCLAVCGKDLEPDEITKMLGCEPTSAHRRGDRMTSGTSRHQGAWSLDVRGSDGPADLTIQLLERLPARRRRGYP
jgi:hypothetical protein